MARFGAFQGPQSPYGVPPNVIHPRDNDITPDAAKLEADDLKAKADDLYTELLNKQRDYTKK